MTNGYCVKGVVLLMLRSTQPLVSLYRTGPRSIKGQLKQQTKKRTPQENSQEDRRYLSAVSSALYSILLEVNSSRRDYLLLLIHSLKTNYCFTLEYAKSEL